MLSIIIVTYKNENTIRECLSSIKAELEKKDEVIVVDNSSSSEIKMIVEGYNYAKYVDAGMNLGFAKANNLGVSRSNGEDLLFLNPDTSIKQGALNELRDAANRLPDFGLIAPKLILKNGEVQASIRRLPSLFGAIGEYFLGIKGRYEAYAPKSQDISTVDSVVGAAVWIRRKIFDKVGGWSEKYFMYYEDLDLCRKIRRAGYLIYLVPSAEFYHQVGASQSELKQKYINQSFYIYHGRIVGLMIRLVLFLRPANLSRILKNLL